MVLVIISSWPPQQAREMMKVAMELPPIPDYINRKAYFSNNVGEGDTCFDIYEFENSRIDEATDYLHSRIIKFYDVPGFTYEVKRWMDEGEVMSFGAKLVSG